MTNYDAQFLERHRPRKLDASKVPEKFQFLIPLAEQWGMIDAVARGILIDQASDEALAEMIESILPHYVALYEWLENDEAARAPTTEYVVFTCMNLAVDTALLRLE